MSKRIISVIMAVVLLLTLSVSVYAERYVSFSKGWGSMNFENDTFTVSTGSAAKSYTARVTGGEVYFIRNDGTTTRAMSIPPSKAINCTAMSIMRGYSGISSFYYTYALHSVDSDGVYVGNTVWN